MKRLEIGMEVWERSEFDKGCKLSIVGTGVPICKRRRCHDVESAKKMVADAIDEFWACKTKA